MKCDLQRISAFLGVEGQLNPNAPEEVTFCLCRPSGQLIVTILSDRSKVYIEILGTDATKLFGAIFECVSISVHDEKPSKLAPHIQMSLAGSSSDFCVFSIYGPPRYNCDFVSGNL
jgi:hypothetical protein